MFNQLSDEVWNWQKATFPYATAQSVANHLRKEAAELADEPYDPSELADVMILLIGLSKLTGNDILDAVRIKLAVNKERKWGMPDAEGVVEHIREPVNA